MKVCFPVQSPRGLQSVINRHFGTAAHFLVVDTGSDDPTPLAMAADGACQCSSPLLSDLAIDAVVCGGIGAGALQRLAGRNVAVYTTDAVTVDGALALLQQGQLDPVRDSTCGAHDHGHQCHGH